MKKTQFKDALRNIAKQKVSYLSIIVIAMIGVTTYLGIDYTVKAMHRNGSNLYNELNYRDIEVVSTMMLTPDDLDCLRSVEGVIDLEPLLYTSAKADRGDIRKNVGVVSLTERINRTRVQEGRLPESETECAVEIHFAKEMDLHVGDSITLLGSDSGIPQYLKAGEMTVTGIAFHPDHTNTVLPDTPYILVSENAFDQEALDGCVMKAEIVIDKPDGLNRFQSVYEQSVKTVLERIETLGIVREKARDDDLRGGWNAELEENRLKLEEAEKKLADARKEIDEKTAELHRGEEELASAEKLLAEGKKLLDDGYIQLESARLQLEDARKTIESENGRLDEGKAELDSAEKQLASAKKELDSGYAQLENAKAQIRDVIKNAYETAFKSDRTRDLILWAKKSVSNADDPAQTARYLWITENYRIDLSRPLKDFIDVLVYAEGVPNALLVAFYEAAEKTEAPRASDGEYDYEAIRKALSSSVESLFKNYEKLQDGCKQWDKGHGEYTEALARYREGLAAYQAGEKLLLDGQAQYEAGVAEYERGLAEYQTKKDEYDKGVLECENARKKIEDGRRQLAEGESEYAKGLLEYKDGREQLSAARGKVDAIDPCKWLVLDGRGNASFVQTTVGSGNLSNLKMTFSLLFILVGVLVIIATVGKMVDEQRKLVGTTKALGFFNREIFAKYLSFGLSAALVGAALGVLAARFGMEPFLLSAFAKYYMFDVTIPTVTLLPTVIAVVACALLASGAVFVTCARLLREPAVRLMQDKAPAGRKGQGKKSVLSLYSRLILLNMRTDLKRVIVTIVSVAGCCALIVIGLTIRSAIGGAIPKQFGPIVDYDLLVTYDTTSFADAGERLEECLTDAGAEYAQIFRSDVTYRVNEMQIGELFCGDVQEIDDFYRLRDVKNGKELFPTNEGVYLQRRIAEIYGLDTGDYFELSVGGVKTAEVRVAGVFENYVGRLIVMSPGYYETLYGQKPQTNAYLVRLNGADGNALISDMRSIDGFESVKYSASDKKIVENSSSMLNAVAALFIFVAAVMAGVVLLNLTNMYILQKKRELTVMRINGFTVKEVIGYVLRETVVTTLLGILIGIAVGAGAAYSIVRTLEQVALQFDRSFDYTAWLIAAAITVIFTVIVNMIALRKVRNLKLTDAM